MSHDAPSLPYGQSNSAYSLPPKRRTPLIVPILVIAGILGLLISVILPNMCRAREAANRIRCRSNMQQIGLGAIMWANDHAGQFPDDLDTILEHQDLSPEAFICPSSKDTAASGPTTQATLANLHQTGHSSYIYLGKGLTNNSPRDAVVLYEQPGNHADDDMTVTSEFRSGKKVHGMNVLCVDGHAEWLNATDADAIRKQAADGTFPVRLPISTGNSN